MKRTKHKKQTTPSLVNYSELANRLALGAYFGKQYGTDRDLYEALGYPSSILYKDYQAKYNRQDMAKAIIDRPVKVTWNGDITVVEVEDDKESQLEKAWKDLNKQLGLKSRFVRLDKLAGIGEYGVLLLGLDDVQKKEDFKEAVKSGARKLHYVKPLGQGSAKISTWEKDASNPRYGLPVLYDVTITSDADATVDQSMKVHYTRVIHVTDDILESEVEGAPRLEVVYNRLMDLEKLVGGDAEMFWRGARPGYQGKMDPDYQMTPATKQDLQEQIDEFEHNMRRILINEGVDLKALEQQLADPKNHVDVQIQMISAVTGIPKRILTGSERGELSSKEDKSEWMAYVQNRRDDYAEPRILRPFINLCIKYKILPKAKDDTYMIVWSDLFALSEKERISIGKDRSTALKEYTANPMAEYIIPPDAFLEFFLGLSDDQIEMIKTQIDAMDKESLATPGEEEIIENE